MATVRVKLNSAGMQELLLSGEVQAMLNGIAEEVAARARATAPVETGEYRDSIHTRENPTPNRARAEVVAEDDKAMVIESRTRNLGSALG